ncbi:MAG: VOC family protein [Bacteroidales bacterium]
MEGSYFISGIQQIGIGVEDFHQAWKWYIEHFQMDVRVLEDSTVAELMLPYTGQQAQKRHACIAINMQGGAGFEIWQYADRKPQKRNFEIEVGDLGVFVAKIKSRNVAQTFEELSAKGVKILGGLQIAPDGLATFYVEDPFANIFQIVEEKSIFKEEKRSSGGGVGVMIGVTDIDKAMTVYRDILGFDQVIYDKTAVFSDLAVLKGGQGKFRRVLLTHSKARTGAFSHLLGKGYIELIVALERLPRKIYEGRFWGDPGFIQVCFDVTYMDNLKKYCEAAGYPFTVDSAAKQHTDSFDMGEAAGRFAYIEDPDGTLIELVETHKIPILKKLGLYLNLRKRNREKALADFLVKMLGLNRVKY